MSPSSTPEASIDKTKVVVAPVYVYPSWREFWDIHSFSLPASPLDATNRLQQNLTHFHVNYLHLIFYITFFYIGFIVTPIVYIVLAAILASCFFYKRYFHPELSNLERPNFNVLNPKCYCILVAVYVVFNIISLYVVGISWIYPLCLLVTFAAVVCLHGMLRAPIYDQYQGLLDAQLQSQPRPQVDV